MAEDTEIRPFRRLETRRAKRRRAERTGAAVSIGATLAYAGAAFLLGRATVFGELHPFWPAFYAALLAVRPEVGWAAALATAAGLASVVRGQAFLAALLGLLFLRLTLGRLTRKVKGTPGVAVAGVGAASIIVPKGLLLALGQDGLDQVLALICEALLAVPLALAFLLVLGNKARQEMAVPLGEEVACWLVFLLGMLLGLHGLKLAGISLLDIGAGLLVLLASLTGGAGGGTVAGVAVGLVPTLTSLAPPSWIALYAVSGLLGGMLASFRRAGVALGFLLGVLLLSVYFFNRAAIVGNIEAALLAVALFFLMPEGVVRYVDWLPLAGERTEEYWQRRLRRMEDRIREQLRQLAAIFHDLGESFRQLCHRGSTNDQVAPPWNELVPRICPGCPAHELCWQKEAQATVHGLGALLPQLQEKGRIEVGDLPGEIRRKCVRPRELVAGVNRAWEDYRRFTTWQERLDETRELVAEQLLQVAGLMGELEKRLNLRGEGDRALAQQVVQALRREGVAVQEVEALVQPDGQVEVRLQLPRCENRFLCRQLLGPLLCRVAGQQMAVDDSRCPWRVGGKECQLRLLPTGILRLEIGLAQAAKDGSAFCGDAWAAAALPGGYYFFGLSDGMGSGPKAAQESEAAMSLLTRLLTLGFMPEMAVRTVNSLLLRPGEQERYATMDLVFINLYSGEGRLIKVGAAPSFLKRGEHVWVLDGGSPPAGILREVELSVTTKWFEPGDLLLLVTDGTLVRGESWLLQALGELKHTEPQAVADLLLHQARALAGSCLRDDMSVFAARVEKVG